MYDRFFSSYNRVKYLLRVKHWHGRSVHSPFLYSVVRECFMRNENIIIDENLLNKLVEKGFTMSHAKRVCRLYTYLGYKSYSFDAKNYNGEDLVIVNSPIDYKSIGAIAQTNSTEQRHTICVVVNNIYLSKKRFYEWRMLSIITGGVAVDMYHTGYIFLDSNLDRQSFKMRF